MLWYRELTAIAFLFILCSSYYVIPLLLLLTPIGAALGSPLCLYLLLLMLGLALVPTVPWRAFRRGWVMSCVLEYFDFRWVLSKDTRSALPPDSTSTVDPYDANRRYLACWMPHGIVPVGTLCGGVYLEKKWPELYGRMAVAPSVLRLPFLRQLLGWFEIQSADYSAMRRGLRSHNVSLMPGGVAELFLCDKEVERVYLQRRRGFCKLALSTGADVSIIYLLAAFTLHREWNRSAFSVSLTHHRLLLLTRRFGATQCFSFLSPHPGQSAQHCEQRTSPARPLSPSLLCCAVDCAR